ncbi:tRNA epoxyqueuosine(34) reductase QueG [Gemmata sp.]|uniref:tRNA epoxyqueuosine(34) reductase QueG n=1 Tax=Gemmata sp. TaxID=1914242 RepID=UPI003F706757
MRNPDQPGALEARLKAEATRLGFSLSGVAPATEADGFARFRGWLDRGYAGEMTYLHEQADQRAHPRSILDGVRSVVMLGMEYGQRGAGSAECGVGSSDAASEIPHSPLRTPHFPGRIAAYAQGPDYHRYIWDRINELAAWLEAEVPGCRTRAVADTAPLLERDFARRAGLGWVGKNTMLINPRRGSFFFLASVLTDLELTPDPPFAGSHCGTCTACLDACPTAAFPEPHVLDATKCISYLTIELRSPVPDELRPKVGDWLYGCDVCQDVCPWNRKPAPGPVGFPHRTDLEWLNPVELLGLDAAAFRARFKATSLWRNRRPGLLRNAALVLGNTGDSRALPALEKALSDPEDVVRDAAAWAIARIRERHS